MLSSVVWAFLFAGLVDRALNGVEVRWALITHRACAVAFLALALASLRELWTLAVSRSSHYHAEHHFKGALRKAEVSMQTFRPQDLDLVESSFYIGEHHVGTATALSLRRRMGASFDVAVGLTVDIDLPDGTALPDVKIQAGTTVTFDGIYIRPNNLVPKPDTPELATAALAPFLSPADFVEPRWTGSGTCLSLL